MPRYAPDAEFGCDGPSAEEEREQVLAGMERFVREHPERFESSMGCRFCGVDPESGGCQCGGDW